MSDEIRSKYDSNFLSKFDLFDNIDILINEPDILSHIDNYCSLYKLFTNETLKKFYDIYGLDGLIDEEFISFIAKYGGEKKEFIDITELQERVSAYYQTKKNLKSAQYAHLLGIEVENYNDIFAVFSKLKSIDLSISMDNPLIDVDILNNKYLELIHEKDFVRLFRLNTKAIDIIKTTSDPLIFEWISFLGNNYSSDRDFIKGIVCFNECYDLINDICKNNGELDKIDLVNLVEIFNNKNEYNVSSIADLKNYSNVKKDFFASFSNDNIKDNSAKILSDRKASDLDSLLDSVGLKSDRYIENILLKNQIITLNEANFVKNLNELLASDDLNRVNILVDELSKERISIDIIVDKIKAYYAKNYNEDMTLNLEREREIPGKTKNVRVVDFDGQDFSMLLSVVTSTNDMGLYGISSNLRNNPEKWISSYGNSTLSCSYISESNMALCLEEIQKYNSLIYGFDNIDSSSLMHMYFSDLGVEHGPGIVDPKVDFSKFISPRMLKQLSLTYNELTLDRRKGNGEKYKPSYIVCFDGQLPEGAIENAEYWDIPIYMVDTKKYLSNNRFVSLKEQSLNNLYKIDENMKEQIQKDMTTFSFSDEEMDYIYNIDKKVDYETNYHMVMDNLFDKLNNKEISDEEYLSILIDILNELNQIDSIKRINSSIYEEIEDIINFRKSLKEIGEELDQEVMLDNIDSLTSELDNEEEKELEEVYETVINEEIHRR